MSLVLSVLSMFLLYIRRFNKDFEEEQATIFVTACIIIFMIAALYIWLTNKA